MEEIWKPIKGYEGLYEVSNHGNVASLNYRGRRERHTLKKGLSPIGYYIVVLCDGERQSTKYVHRLVAETFIPNTEKKPAINHKNSNRADNRVENLEWVTFQENSVHACKNGRVNMAKAIKASAEKNRRPVLQINLDGSPVCAYGSYSEAERATKVSRNAIASCAKGQRESAGGYRWVAFRKRA